jgi:hypothetical protein
MQAVNTSETSGNFYQTTVRSIKEKIISLVFYLFAFTMLSLYENM